MKPKLNHFHPRRVLWHHPPALVAVPIAAGIQLAFLNAIAQTPESQRLASDALHIVYTSLALTLGLLIVLSIPTLTRQIKTLLSSKNKPIASDTPKVDFSDIDSLLPWIAREEPIHHSSSDLFHFKQRAQQILNTLATTHRDTEGNTRPQTVVIQGPYGSGKTSLVHLAETIHQNEASPQIRFLFVHLNCWGFESTARLHEHVLSRCVEKLHEHIDCTSLRDMPSRYAQAISSASPKWFQSILRLALSRSPQDLIGKFGPLLEAAKLQLVAVIEDTDRNGPDFDPSQIEALLYHFRTVKGLSFIFTSGPQDKIEYPKIAEAIHYLPSLPQAKVLAALSTVYKHCREKYPRALLSNDHNGYPRKDPVQELSTSDSDFENAWTESVCKLFARPRQLKTVLRALIRTWDSLAGEVELDELLMVLTLRHAAPSAHTFLGAHFEKLRSLSISGSQTDDKHKKSKKHLNAAWRKITKSADYDINAVEQIISALLPQASEIFNGAGWTRNHRVQSVFRSGGPDYWTRINDEFLDEEEIRDQAVIKLAKDSLTNPDSSKELAELIVDSQEAADLLTYFVQHYRFPIETRLNWFSERNDLLRSKLGVAAKRSSGGPFDRYDPLSHRLTEFHSDKEETILPWLNKELEKSLPNHLKFACELYVEFARDKSFECKARRPIHKKLKELFELSSDLILSNGLDPQFPYTLNYLIFCYGNQGSESLLARPEDWSFLAPYILKEFETHSNTMIPAVVFAFGHALPENGPYTHVEFRKEDITTFFGDRESEVYQTIASYDPANAPLNGHELERLKFAIEAAKKITLENEIRKRKLNTE